MQVMLNGFLVISVWCILSLRMKQTSTRYGLELGRFGVNGIGQPKVGSHPTQDMNN